MPRFIAGKKPVYLAIAFMRIHKYDIYFIIYNKVFFVLACFLKNADMSDL